MQKSPIFLVSRLDNLLRDCQAMSRRCSCNQPSMKGRFRDFWESLDPSKKKDNFFFRLDVFFS